MGWKNKKKMFTDEVQSQGSVNPGWRRFIQYTIKVFSVLERGFTSAASIATINISRPGTWCFSGVF